jgi:hypothetical protein
MIYHTPGKPRVPYCDPNPERLRTQRLKRYGITLAQYDKMLTEQGFACAICGDGLEEWRAFVDHCHTTNKVRGILCPTCNTGISYFKDSPERLFSAATFLTPALQVA